MKLILIGVLVWCVNSWGLSKTRGTPLGGMGTGYVKFDARTGDFAASSRIPPGGGDMVCEFPGKMSSSSGFHFFAGGESVKKAKTEKEDAKCPLYTADFGNIKNVNFSLKAFGPFIPGDSELNNKLAASPLAFFEITAKNEGSSAIEVAVALEFTNKSSERNGLLGGEPNALIDKEMGNKSIFFPRAKYNDVPSNPNNEGEAYIIVNCSKDGTIYSAGALGEFLTKGILSNTDGNCVAAKCNIEAGESVRFKFVMAWWRTFVSGIGRYDSSKIDEDNFYYHNFYKNSKEAALFGMEYFDKVRDGVVLMVNRVMGSNFPDWYKDRLLNNTYPLIHNSVWTKDGRVAFWEGGYGILGTLDQGQHAAIWYIYNWPHNQWLELTYWIRNRWRYPNSKNDPTLVGQIHHDFNMGPERGFIPRESAFMAPWDHFDRPDYFWDNDATDWSDLNVMLIFKAYELVIATGKVDSISKWYPQILETATRLYKMAENVKSYLPYLSSSSYDSDHSFIFSEYVSGTAIVAYKAMEEIANMIGDKETAEKYRNIYENARKEYKERFFNESFGTIGGKNRLWQEGNVAGYSWADYFCFEPIMDEDFIKEGCRRIWNKYASQTDERLKVGEWHFYTVDHFGGALTAINLPDSALKLHQIDHKIYYVNLPELVFWQTLFSGNISDERYSSYMT
ncbi:MAG: non-lysosomal glucosylceramidase, partial [Chitinispirillaceae bacterium]|nr:non-lysosomal glucosylceramidase [Chitinispirillaceae bacterium]